MLLKEFLPPLFHEDDDDDLDDLDDLDDVNDNSKKWIVIVHLFSDKEAKLYSMLPLFCKIFNSVPPSVITEKFVEAVQFTQVKTLRSKIAPVIKRLFAYSILHGGGYTDQKRRELVCHPPFFAVGGISYIICANNHLMAPVIPAPTPV